MDVGVFQENRGVLLRLFVAEQIHFFEEFVPLVGLLHGDEELLEALLAGLFARDLSAHARLDDLGGLAQALEQVRQPHHLEVALDVGRGAVHALQAAAHDLAPRLALDYRHPLFYADRIARGEFRMMDCLIIVIIFLKCSQT